MRNLKIWERAYLGAILDTDGTIKVTGRGKKKKNYNRPSIEICNTNLELLETIRKIIGSGTIREKRYRNRSKKTQYVYRLPSKDTAEFLKQVFPFLVVKRERAKLCIEFFEEDKFRRSIRGSPLTSRQVELLHEIRRLNAIYGHRPLSNKSVGEGA